MRWQPRSYQTRALRFLVSRPGAALFAKPGAGKTTISLAAFKALKKKGVVSSVLVLAPLRVATLVWPREIEKFDEFRGLSYAILHGPKKDVLWAEEHDVYILNPEGLPWLAKKAAEGWTFPEMLVVDESTRFKNASIRMKRFSILRRLLNKFSRRYVMTGTPAPNGEQDLFGQALIVDGGAALGSYVTHFRSRFCRPAEDGYGYDLLPGASKEIFERIAPFALVIDEEVEAELPPLHVVDVPVRLDDAAFDLYDSMERSFFAELDAGRVTAANSGVRSVKLRQMASGGVYDDAGVPEFVHSAKLDALRELLDEMGGEPTLVAYQFRHERELFREYFPDAPAIGGGVSKREASAALNAWNAGELPVLFLQSDSAAHGLNLQDAGHRLIWYTPTWNYEHYDQLIRRIWRPGQRSGRVVVYRLLAEDTVDRVVVDVVRGKSRVERNVFEALRRYRRGKKK